MPDLENTRTALQGSRMFTPLEGAAAGSQMMQPFAPQQQRPRGVQDRQPPPQNEQAMIMAAVSQMQNQNQVLRNQVAVLSEQLTAAKNALSVLSAVPSPGCCNGGSKRGTELIVIILIALFLAVLVILFVFSKKLKE